jgi:RNA polymerase sigma factor (sigma-70 family)
VECADTHSGGGGSVHRLCPGLSYFVLSCYLSPVSGIHLQMLELADSALLKEYVEHGSEEAFATLVARHVNKVYSIALRHTRNAHQAEEITQSVFVILARKSRQLGKRVILSGWLCRTARLSAVTFLRSEMRRTRREQEAHMQNLLKESESEVWPQIAPLLDTAMAGLSEADHDAVALRFLDGKSMKEIGAVLGASEDAVKMRVSRAVEKLRVFFTRRGIVCSAAALTAAISTHAVQAAPVGLDVTISTTTALAAKTATIGKAIAMTTLQKTVAVIVVAAAASLGVLVPTVWVFWPSLTTHAAKSQGALGWIEFGNQVAPHGLVSANQQQDGVTEPSVMGGLECHALQRYPGRPELYAYFRIEPALKSLLTNLCIVEVEYFDADGGGILRLDYDSHDETSKALGAYTQSKEKVNLKGTLRWRKARFLLDNARFEGRQNDQADFRVTFVGPQFFLRSVNLFLE